MTVWKLGLWGGYGREMSVDMWLTWRTHTSRLKCAGCRAARSSGFVFFFLRAVRLPWDHISMVTCHGHLFLNGGKSFAAIQKTCRHSKAKSKSANRHKQSSPWRAPRRRGVAAAHIQRDEARLQHPALALDLRERLGASRSRGKRSVLGSWVRRTAPFYTFPYSQPRPAWCHPKILVPMRGGRERGGPGPPPPGWRM